MIKIEKTRIYGFEPAIRGMRNPMNSWDRSDSDDNCEGKQCSSCLYETVRCENAYLLGEKDLNLAIKLSKAGRDHAKFRRMIVVYADITAPLYWWKEFDTYKVGTVANSCSTMHTIHTKEFTLDDFSHEHLMEGNEAFSFPLGGGWRGLDAVEVLTKCIIAALNNSRKRYLATNDAKYWWQMIQLLPSSYNQKRTVMLNYEVLSNIYHARKNHKLDEWRSLCDWINTLPYSKLITLED